MLRSGMPTDVAVPARCVSHLACCPYHKSTCAPRSRLTTHCTSNGVDNHSIESWTAEILGSAELQGIDEVHPACSTTSTYDLPDGPLRTTALSTPSAAAGHGASTPTSFEPSPLLLDGSWILAAGVLFAARIGRVTAEESRLDVRQLQFQRKRTRVMDKELLEARQRWRESEAERVAAEDQRRVAEAAARAKLELERQQQVQRQYQEAAAKEAERLREDREAQRRQFLQKQAQLDAEAAARAEQERQLIEQQRAAARAADEQRRKDMQERRRAQEEERRLREELEQFAREEAIRRKLEERQRLEREKKKFTLRLEGQLALERPPKGTLLPGPLKKEASIRLTISCSTLLGGAAQPVAKDFINLSDAMDALPGLAGKTCQAGTDGFVSAARLQSMAGEGVLQWIDDVELQSWAHIAAARSAMSALAAYSNTVPSSTVSTMPLITSFQCRTELGVLPADNVHRLDLRLRRLISLIEASSVQEALTLLDDILDTESDLFVTGLPSSPQFPESVQRLLGSSLCLAHLVSRTLHERPYHSSDAPAWFETMVQLVRSTLQAAAQDATPDTLQPAAQLLSAVLGPRNPVSEEMCRLAEANMSSKRKKDRLDREQRLAVELAAKLAEEEWPDAADTKAARLAEREASTPIPERCWALRNVAGTLSMGGPGEKGRARQLLEKAVQLKQQYAGAPDHPGVLPELVALFELLCSSAAWERDAAAVAALAISAVINLASAFQQTGDQLSAVLLLEAGLRKFEEAVGVRHPAVRLCIKKADAAMESLDSAQKEQLRKNRLLKSDLINRATVALTDDLGAYQLGSPIPKLDLYNQQGAALIGPMY